MRLSIPQQSQNTSDIMSGYIVTFCQSQPLAPLSLDGRGGETTLAPFSYLGREFGDEGLYCKYSTGLDMMPPFLFQRSPTLTEQYGIYPKYYSV